MTVSNNTNESTIIDPPQTAADDVVEMEAPEQFVCPITQQVFKDPVMDLFGHTYERNAILSWLGRTGTCPMTRRPMKASDFIPNALMKTRIQLWKKETGLDKKCVEEDDQHDHDHDGAVHCLVGYYTLEEQGEDETEEESDSGNEEGDDTPAPVTSNNATTTRQDRLSQLLAEYMNIQREFDDGDHPEEDYFHNGSSSSQRRRNEGRSHRTSRSSRRLRSSRNTALRQSQDADEIATNSPNNNTSRRGGLGRMFRPQQP